MSGEREGITGEVDAVAVGVGDKPLLGEEGLVGEREGDSRDDGDGVRDIEGEDKLLTGDIE